METCPGSDLANGHDAAGNNESKTWEFCPFAAALGAPAALSDSDAPIPSLEQARSNERWSAYVDIANILDEEYVANHSVRNVATANDAILNPGEPLSASGGDSSSPQPDLSAPLVTWKNGHRSAVSLRA